MADKFPLVVYGKDGKRKVIGEAEIKDGKILAEITDPEAADLILDKTDLSHFSIGEDVKPKRRNVFDRDEKD